MAWEEFARKLSAKNGDQYAHTGETMEDAILRTCLLGETGMLLGTDWYFDRVVDVAGYGYDPYPSNNGKYYARRQL
ncbi:hypothetical protein INS49_014134 [Diaporthe citri]|uniref:uncharacterized protein n=1 Tax=Diaporthe citri TaxID=83186 RepID=UPI001C814D84|nr:uncharacterized protein INS49_014134 [Diaporthe citri]KAG6358250.1 hypothetical protein INS49_014134 [Diaporthe citri]